jgi:hypothetical protein
MTTTPYAEASSRTRHGSAARRRTFTETRLGLLTTEFMLTIGFVIAVLASSYYGDTSTSFDHRAGWLFATIVVVAYVVSRGLAKLGTREPYMTTD